MFAIQLDPKSSFGAVEVQDEESGSVLAAELEPGELAIPEVTPGEGLRLGLPGAKLSFLFAIQRSALQFHAFAIVPRRLLLRITPLTLLASLASLSPLRGARDWRVPPRCAGRGTGGSGRGKA